MACWPVSSCASRSLEGENRVEGAESAGGDGENLGERVQPAVQGSAGN